MYYFLVAHLVDDVITWCRVFAKDQLKPGAHTKPGARKKLGACMKLRAHTKPRACMKPIAVIFCMGHHTKCVFCGVDIFIPFNSKKLQKKMCVRMGGEL
jgi:hypothetical protein